MSTSTSTNNISTVWGVISGLHISFPNGLGMFPNKNQYTVVYIPENECQLHTKAEDRKKVFLLCWSISGIKNLRLHATQV